MWSPSFSLFAVVALVTGSAAQTPENFDELFPPESTAAAPSVAAPSPLVAHLTFDVAGDLNADSSGKKNSPATGGRPSAAEGVFGGAVEFDEKDFFVWQGERHPLVKVLDGSFTICVWVKTTKILAADGAEAWDGAGIVWADFPGYKPPNGDAIPLAVTGSKAAAFISGGRVIHSVSAVNTGEWVHLAFVRRARAVGGYSKLYVNGKAEATGTGDARPLSDAKRLAVGGNLIDGRHFTGLMDDLRVYNTDLSEGEIVALSTLALAKSKLTPAIQTKVRELEERFEADRLAKVEAAYDQGLKDLRVKYLAALKRASESAVQARDLQAAVAFQREIKDVESGIPPRAEDGPGAPSAMVALRKAYREAIPSVAATRVTRFDALIKRQDAALATLQATLAQSGKPGDISALKTYRALSASRKAPPIPVLATETADPSAGQPPGSPTAPGSAFGTRMNQ